MTGAAQTLSELQSRVADRSDPGYPLDFQERVLFAPLGPGWHVEFYGSPFEESFSDFLRSISRPEVANRLVGLTFDGPDDGSNGTKDWNFRPLLDEKPVFSKLSALSVARTLPEHHNQSVVAEGGYDEAGQIAELLACCPVLEHLTVPSAPSATFFQQGERPLKELRVHAGYDTQDFIWNLARSFCFPELRDLELGNFDQSIVEQGLGEVPPFKHYRAFFLSPASASLRQCTLRNTLLTEDELGQLRQMRPSCSLVTIQSTARRHR